MNNEYKSFLRRPENHQDWTEFQSRFSEPLSFNAYICICAGAPSAAIVEAERHCSQTGAALHEHLIARGLLNADRYCAMLAEACDFDVADAGDLALRGDTRQPWRLLQAAGAMPLNAAPAKAALIAENATAQSLKAVSDALGPSRAKIALTTRRALAASLNALHAPRLTRRAIYGLSARNTGESAHSGVWLWQWLVIAGFIGASAGAAALAPRETLTILCAAFSLVFFLGVALRAYAAVHAVFAAPKLAPPPIPERDLPRYSVLAPLFHESAVLPDLVAALSALDYPTEKLDIKLILESVDTETIAAVSRMALPGNFQVIVAPDSRPRTKPKALNYALQFATGDYIVIYDAEDKPAAEQLRQAAAAFAAAPPEVVCLQARLAYHNHGENWIARQFAIEYASLFGGVLPMLDTMRLPLPLGGTSNHFRARALRRLGAWDAFNVTEDADLGMRIHRAGLRCRTLDSDTWEEAACRPGDWIKQRSRWLKGWMQTYGVHMRQPVRLARDLGFWGFLAFQAHFASVIVSALAHPLAYLLIVADMLTGYLFATPNSLLGQSFMALAAFNFATGYLATVALGAVALKRRGLMRLAPHLLLIPVYWLMISAAAYRALWQLIAAPFHWDKTPHGMTRARSGP